MKKQQIADGLPKKDVAAQTTDNAAANTGNSSTVHIGKGSDESVTTKIELHDSTISINLNTIHEEEDHERISCPAVRRKARLLTFAAATAMAVGLGIHALRFIHFNKDKTKQ